jgi:hypothetical protein
MWSLVPSGDYEAARAIWLMDGEHDKIREQTDRYWLAQKNAHANILGMQDKGVHVYAIAEYNLPLVPIVSSYDKLNADGVIHLDSTSLGATSGYVDTPLPADYKQQNTHCKVTGHNHISPDGIIDASTGVLADYTFFFKGQSHEGTSKDDVILRLVTRLSSAADYETVYSMPEWPQFNNGRETRDLRNNLLPDAKKIDMTKLSAEDAAELAAAIAQVEDVLAKSIVVPGESQTAEARLYAIMVKLGQRTQGKEDVTAKLLDPVFGFLNDALYYAYGPRGFSDSILAIWK